MAKKTNATANTVTEEIKAETGKATSSKSGRKASGKKAEQAQAATPVENTVEQAQPENKKTGKYTPEEAAKRMKQWYAVRARIRKKYESEHPGKTLSDKALNVRTRMALEAGNKKKDVQATA